MNKDDNDDDELEKGCVTTSGYDTVVSDDDTAIANKTSTSSCYSSSTSKTTTKIETDLSSSSGTDDEETIESDQPLFLDDTIHVNNDPLLGCNVGVIGEDDALMAEFLKDTFVAYSKDQSTATAAAASTSFVDDDNTVGIMMDANEMESFLIDENDAMMLLPELCLEN